MKRIKSCLAAIVALLTMSCTASANQSTMNNQDETSMDKNGKTLVVFFSHAGENYSVGNIEVGNTKVVADYISEMTGADQFEIVADKDYDMPYMQLIEVAKQEANNHELPPMVGKLENVDQYDTVFIGGPVWWGTYPQVMFTFFRDYDLNGKTLIPFTTHEGSGLASCVEDVKEAYPNADVKPGFAIYGHEVRSGRNKVEKWLKNLGFWQKTIKTDNFTMETIKLSNGVEMPVLGYGVFQVSPEECERCVSDAIEVGYRLIDTAQAYFNEEGVGNAIVKSGVPRNELFITTKVWISNAGEERATRSIDESLRKLQTDYIDLLLIHQPYGDYYGSYRAMERALEQGKVRAIGVSNFQAGRFVDLALKANVKPMVNQLETNVFSQQNDIMPWLAEFGTMQMAWAPLGQGRNNLFADPVLTEIGSRYGKSPAQVALRWLTQRGIVAIPKSTHRDRMAQNLDIFDFKLTPVDIQRIAQMNQTDDGTVNFNDPNFIKYLIETYG